MSRGPLRGTAALLLAPGPGMPPARPLVSRRLADHVGGFLIWLEHALARQPNTVQAYGQDVRMFIAFCQRAGVEGVEQVTFHHVEAFGAALRAHLGQQERSIARRYSALRKFFFYLERHGLVAKNPATLALPMKQPPRRPPNYMTKAERGRVLEVFRKRESLRGRRNYALLATMFYAGLRESELCQLTVGDVDLGEGSLYVRNGKGRKDRRVPIPPTLVRILKGWITAHRPRCPGAAAGPWLFVRRTQFHKYAGRPLDPKAIWHLVRDHVVPILGRRVSPHTFRHSYVTHIYEASGDLRLAQHLAGHESISTTQIYAHVTPRKERERLAELLR